MTDKPHLDRAHAQHLFKEMLRIRRFEAKCVELYQAQKIRGFLHLYDGEEAVAVGICQVLGPQDAVVATYREHGQAIARGIAMGPIMAEMFGKREGTSRGRGGSMHIFDASRRLYGGNAIVGGGLPIAVGLALADKLQGNARVNVAFFGEGAVAEGAFHESMNLAALWRLPVAFFCENNLYAMGTALDRSESQTDLCAKAAAFRVPWKHRGPIHNLSDRLKAEGRLTEDEFLAIDAEAQREVEEAVAFAEAGTWEPVEDLGRDVHTEAAR